MAKRQRDLLLYRHFWIFRDGKVYVKETSLGGIANQQSRTFQEEGTAFICYGITETGESVVVDGYNGGSVREAVERGKLVLPD